MQTVGTEHRIDTRVSPPHRLGQSIEQQILQTVVSQFDDKTVRTKFVQMAMAQAGVIGVCYLSKDPQDKWSPAIDRPSSGRLPKLDDFSDQFSAKCDAVVSTPNAQLEPIASLDAQGIFAPIRPRGANPEIFFAIAPSQDEAMRVVGDLQKMSSALQLWLGGKKAADADWQVLALAAIIDLVGKIESNTSTESAAEETANLLASRTGCNSVAVGLLQKGRLRLKAVSGVAKIDHGSDSSHNYLQALAESVIRKQPGVYPPTDPENNHLLQAHKQLASVVHADSVLSQPLLTDDDTVVGSLVMTGSKELLQSSQVSRFSDTAAPAIANAFRVIEKVERNRIGRAIRRFQAKLNNAKRVVLGSLLLCACLIMLLPITYRVRCNCVTEPVSRRFAVAPFDGQIVVGHKESGDSVKAGDLLAEMDGRTIRWELSGVTAERKQSLRTREIELSERNVPKTILAELEYDRLVSEESVLKYKRDHLLIRSPIDGVVLSGSLERAEAASVETGEVLFEIGPMQPMRVEIAVPSSEIAQVKPGFPVKAWIDGQESDPITGEITKIHPRSETRDAETVFIAEVEFPNHDERLRPGMNGSARIDCEKRSLAWSLFHKPINYVRARFTWW